VKRNPQGDTGSGIANDPHRRTRDFDVWWRESGRQDRHPTRSIPPPTIRRRPLGKAFKATATGLGLSKSTEYRTPVHALSKPTALCSRSAPTVS
jgi:hypothetical protein